MFDTKLPMNLQFFAEEGATGVDVAPVAEEQTDAATPESPETGVEQEQPVAEVKDEKDFAKALKAREEQLRKQIEAEYSERFKDYDVSKKALDFLMKTNNISDPMTLKEQIELEELREKAERENLTVEELQRRQELEELKAWKQQVEQQQQQQEQMQQFESQLKEFCKDKEIDGKPLDHMELWQFMFENGVSKPEVALKAMKADMLEKQIESAKKDGVKEFLSAKGSIPKVEGANKSGSKLPGTPKTFAEARARAMQREL